MLSDTSVQVINISWSLPIMPNGHITLYEIRYREFSSNGPYNMTTTTSTVYSIGGLVPNTSYTIRVRAHTSGGPGEWTDITSKISLYLFLKFLFSFSCICFQFLSVSSQLYFCVADVDCSLSLSNITLHCLLQQIN